MWFFVWETCYPSPWSKSFQGILERWNHDKWVDCLQTIAPGEAHSNHRPSIWRDWKIQQWKPLVPCTSWPLLDVAHFCTLHSTLSAWPYQFMYVNTNTNTKIVINKRDGFSCDHDQDNWPVTKKKKIKFLRKLQLINKLMTKISLWWWWW